QQASNAGKRSAVVEQMSNGTQQVAEQVAGSRLRGDVEHYLIQVYHQAEQVEIKRSEHQVQNIAGATRGYRKRDQLANALYRARDGVGQGARQLSHSYELTVLDRKALDRERTREADEL